MATKSLKDLKQEYAPTFSSKTADSKSILDLKRQYNAANVAKDIQSRLTKLGKDSQSLLDGYNSRFFDKDGKYITDVYRSSEDAGNWLYDVETQREALETEGSEIKKLLADYGEYFDKDMAANINSILDGNVKVINGIVSNSLMDKEYWDKFETEDEYNEAVQTQKNYDEMASANLLAIGKEILDKKSILKQAKKLESSPSNVETETKRPTASRGGISYTVDDNGNYTLPPNKENAELINFLKENGYSSIDELETDISNRGAYYKQAERIQEGIKYAGVADPESKYYDPNFNKYVEMGKTYYDSNHPDSPSVPNVNFDQKGYRADTAEAVGEYAKQLDSFEYTNMTNDEREIYHYYLGKAYEESNGGKVSEETAEKYVNLITDAINARHAEKMAKDFANEGKLTQLAFSVYSGLESWTTGVENFFNFSDDYIPQTATALASQMVREDMAEDGWLWGVAYDLGNTTANMFPSIALSYVPFVGQGLSLASTGISAAGHAYTEALNNGYSKEQARGYSVLVGGSEAGLQYLLGGISRLGGKLTKGAVSKLATKATANIGKAYAKIAVSSGIKLVGSMASEFGEEYLQEVLTPVFKNVALDTNEEVKLFSADAAYAGFLGALSAGLLEGGSIVSGEIGTYKAGKSVIEKGQVDALAKLGASFSADSVAHKIASKVNEKTDAYTLGQLLREVGADHLSAENIADITAELERKGMSLSDAQSIAKWLNKAVEGEYFTKGQISALENNEIISDVFRDVILNKNSSVNQRNQEYQAILRSLEQAEIDTKAPSEKLSVLDETAPTTETASATSAVPYSSEYISSVAKVYEEMGMPAEQAKNMAMAQLSQSNPNTSSSTDKNPTESKFEVSDDGKTINLKTDKEVNISKIDSISESGEANLTLDDGMVVKASDVAFGSPVERALIEGIGDIKIGKSHISTDSANDLYQAAMTEWKSNPDMTTGKAVSLVKGLAESYVYGAYNFGEDRLTATNEDGSAKYFAGELSQTQRKFAYELGTKDSIAKAEADQKVIDDIKAKADPKAKNKHLGKVIFEGDIAVDELGLTDTQKANLDGIKLLADTSNIEFHVFMSDENLKFTLPDGAVRSANGWYVSGTNEIWIDLKAGNFGQGTMLWTAGHEISHYIKQWSPKQWKAMADLIFDTFAKNDVNIESMMNKQKAKIRKRYNKKNMPSEAKLTDMAYEEFVSDALTNMLTDGSIVNFIAEVKQKNKSLTKKILDAIKKLLNKWGLIIDDYKGRSLEVEEAQALSQFEDTFKKLQEMYQEALMDADESVALLDNAKPISSDEIITDGATVTDSNGNVYSIRSMKSDIAEGQMFEDLKTYCGFTQRQVNTLKEQLEDLVEYMTPFRDIVDLNETYGREGRRFAPYKPNSDPLYTISLDFSTQCSKRLLTQYVIEQLQLREKRPMSAEEQMAIRDMLKEYGKIEKGLQVACVMCYVEAARLKSPKQIQKWLDDPATVMRNYFADKNPEFSAYIKKAQEDFKESRGYARNASKKEMKEANKKNGSKDVTALNKIRPKLRAEYKPSTEEMAIIETAVALPKETFLTAGNLANLSEEHSEIYKAFTAFIRTATRSKALETDEPYYYGDSTRDNGNGIIVSDSFIEAVNRENGMRFSSWSDWRIQHLLDWITAVIDNSVRGAAMHGYTKYGDEVRVLGNTGMMFNMSGVPGTQTGLNEDGSLNFSETESMDYNEAIALRKEFPETAGLQCIGVSVEHIFALLRSDIIDYVIPYHTSGLNATLRRMGDIYGWKDFTLTQHATENKSIKKENAVDPEHWHQEPVFSEFFVGYNTKLGGVEAMRKSADNYIRMCEERGLTPKFVEFSKEPNYWKLLIDRKMVNQKTNTLIEQKPVTPKFDFDVIKGIVDQYVKNYDSGLEERAFNHIVENWDNIPQRIRDLKKQGTTKAKSTKKAIDKLANEPLAAQPKGEIKPSERDSAYLDTVNRGDTETAQRMVDDAAKQAGAILDESGNPLKLYRGTKGGQTVFAKETTLNGKIYTIDNINVATKYGDKSGKATEISNQVEGEPTTYALYGFPKKMLTLDAQYGVWSDLLIPEELLKYSDGRYKATNAEIAEWAETEGYDALRIDNVRDGSFDAGSEIIFFDVNLVKSADAITKDDNGKVIPLSERFNAENEDIRYSERASNKELASMDETALYIKNTKKANYIGMIFNGTKTEETRSRRTLDAFIGKDFYVTDGKYVYGSVVFGEPHKYTEEEFHKLENRKKHRVPKGDEYDVKPGGIKWAYPIESYNKFDKPKKLSDSKEYKNSFQARQVMYSERVTERTDEVTKQLSKKGKKYNALAEKRDSLKKLTYEEFKGFYHAHKFLRGETEAEILEKIESIKKNGFKSYSSVNFASADNDNSNISKVAYRPFKDEYVLLIPDFWTKAKENYILDGYKPLPYEIVKVEYNSQPYYELYSKAYNDYFGIEGDDYVVNKYRGYSYAELKELRAELVDKALKSNAKKDWDKADEVGAHMRRYFNKDGIRYSDRDPSTSNRTILANSLESAAQNDIERNKLAQYKEKISLIEAEEQKLAEIQKKLFTKGAVEPTERKDLQFEAKQISNRINTYDRQLLNLEATKALKNVLNREKSLAMKRQKQKDDESRRKAIKEKVAKTTRELMDRHMESRKKATESRNRTAMRHKIQSVVSELNTLLTHGNKKKHVPEDLKVAVAEVLELFNMDTVGAEERVAKYDALIAKAKDPDVIASLTETRDRIQAQGDKFNARLMKLKSAYDTIKSSADPEMAGGFDEVISSRIEYVASIVGKTPLRNMTLEQLEAVHDVYTMVLNNIREANALFKKDKAETIQNYASRVVGEVKQAGGEHEFTSPRTSKIKEFLWNNLKPIFAFEKIGSKTLTDLFEDVRKGEDTWAVDITDAKSFADSEYDKYNYKKWDFDKKYTFKSTTGEQFSLTLDQMLSLYAYSKRPQAGDHLRIGGFVFDDSITTYKEKENGKQSVLKYNVNIAKAHQISINTLADIIGNLTEEQKGFVDEMQTYLSDVMGAKGNEVSMTLYNIRLFKEKNYFPLKSAKQFMFEQNEVAGEVKIKNSGFTESTVEHANNPIILNNFMDVWANHVNDMSMYHSFVVPLENFNRVFNYQTRRAEGMPPVSVKETLQNAYGTHAVSYIRQLLTDLNGGARSDPRESTAKKLLSTFKKAKVFTSASVVIQQPSAVARALAFIDAKYFDFNPKLIKHKERWEELKKYAPVAIIKEMGRFDTDMGLSTAEYIKDQKTLMQKAEDWLSKAPAYADELVWVHIWEAVKRETKAKHPDLKVGSEEFLKTAGERFTEVISKTQVYDSVLSKSANMRSKSGLMAMMTAFMAEPTTSINMVEQGLRLWKRGYKRLALKQLKGVGASIILNSALVSLIYAMRDDDEDETYLEKYLGSFVSETVDGFNPLTYFPIVKDVWSLLQGYDVERSDMSLFSDAIDSLSDITKTLASYDEDMTDEEAQKFKDDMVSSSLKLVDGVAALFGIPVGNIRRDINSIINTYKTVTNGASTSGTSLKNELTESVKDTTPVWGWLPDKQKSDKLYEAIMEKDTAYVDRLKSGYKDDKAYETALRKALRENDPRIKEAAEARFNGDFDEYERLFEEIENEGNFEFDTIKSAINTEFNKLDTDDEEEAEEDVDKVESIYSTSDMNAAFENGDTSSALEIIDDIVKVKTENYINEGEKEKDAEKKAKSSVKSSMTSYWKPLYIAAYNNKDNAEMARIRKILLSSGLYGRANDVIKTGQDWIKNSKK